MPNNSTHCIILNFLEEESFLYIVGHVLKFVLPICSKAIKWVLPLHSTSCLLRWYSMWYVTTIVYCTLYISLSDGGGISQEDDINVLESLTSKTLPDPESGSTYQQSIKQEYPTTQGAPNLHGMAHASVFSPKGAFLKIFYLPPPTHHPFFSDIVPPPLNLNNFNAISIICVP